MSVEAVDVDLRLTFNYTVEIEGLLVARVSAIQIPEIELAKAEHSGPGAVYSSKTAGKIKVGDITLEKVMPAESADPWAWNWLKTARNPVTGRGAVSSKYKKTILIAHLGEGDDIIDRYECKGVFPFKISRSKNDGQQEAERMIETIMLSCDILV